MRILKEIQSQFADAMNRGLVLTTFIIPDGPNGDGVLNIGVSRNTSSQVIDRLLEHIRRKWPQVEFRVFNEDLEGCIAIQIREKRRNRDDRNPFIRELFNGDWLAEEEQIKPEPKGNMLICSAEVYEELSKAIDPKPKKKGKKNVNKGSTNRRNTGSRTSRRKNILRKKPSLGK